MIAVLFILIGVILGALSVVLRSGFVRYFSGVIFMIGILLSPTGDFLTMVFI